MGSGLRHMWSSHKRRLKRTLLKEAHHKCSYCHTPLDFASATLDHIKPVARNGKTGRANLCIACRDCNERKGKMRVEEFVKARQHAADLQSARKSSIDAAPVRFYGVQTGSKGPYESRIGP